MWDPSPLTRTFQSWVNQLLTPSEEDRLAAEYFRSTPYTEEILMGDPGLAPIGKAGMVLTNPRNVAKIAQAVKASGATSHIEKALAYLAAKYPKLYSLPAGGIEVIREAAPSGGARGIAGLFDRDLNNITLYAKNIPGGARGGVYVAAHELVHALQSARDRFFRWAEQASRRFGEPTAEAAMQRWASDPRRQQQIASAVERIAERQANKGAETAFMTYEKFRKLRSKLPSNLR